MTAEAAQKYRRFVEMCDTFHVPVVNFVDQPGFMIGPESEQAGTIRYGMAAVAAAAQATIPGRLYKCIKVLVWRPPPTTHPEPTYSPGRRWSLGRYL